MAARDSGNLSVQLTCFRMKHQSEESRIQKTNYLSNEDVKYPPTILENQSLNTPSTSTGFDKNPMSSTVRSTQQSRDGVLPKELHENTSGEKEASLRNGSADVVKEEKVPMRCLLYKFSSVIEGSMNANFPTLSVKFERDEENAICILKGTFADIQKAKVKLQEMEKTLYERKVIFPTNISSTLSHISIEKIVIGLLKDKYPGCVAQQLNNILFLYGFDEGLVNKAKMFLSTALTGKDVLLCGRVREKKKNVLDYFMNRYKSRIGVYIDNTCRLYMVGQKEAVVEAGCDFVEINEGRRSLPSADASLEVTQCSAQDNHREISICNLPDKKLTYPCEKMQITKELHNDRSTWSTSGGKLLTVEYFSFKNSTADLKFVMKMHDPIKGVNIKAETGNTVEIAVPDFVNRGATDNNTINRILQRALEKAADRNARLVAFLISPFANWDFDSLMKCMVKGFVDWLLVFPKKKCYSILLCTEDRGYFARTDEFIGICLRNKVEEANVLREPPRVLVVKGHLDQASTEVIVNTADSSLDLSYGKVSSALLRAAGQRLQTECREHHSKGIKCDEIAVTDGYNLKCKAVFHITLQSQDRSDKGLMESIRNAMLLCLKTASDYRYKSLSFPAMGTGSLKYPPDQVASEMIMAVERFTNEYSNSSIEEVQIVIFPSDKNLLQTFQRLAKKLAPTTVQYFIQNDMTGLEQNIKDCKTWLKSSGNASTTDMNFYSAESTKPASAKSSLDENMSKTRYFESSRSYLCGNITIRVCVADILDAPVDCIVNAANGDLDHCGGIAHYIVEAAGNVLRVQCAALRKEKGHLPVASVEVTSAGNLTRYKCLLHAVGPDYKDYAPITKSNLDKCEHDLYDTVSNCLSTASDMKLTSIALPTISSGLFRVPQEVCAIQYAKAVQKFSSTTSSLREVLFVDKNRAMIDILHTTFDAMIKHGKSAPFHTSKFIEKDADVGQIRRKQAFKNTARDCPKSVIKDLSTKNEKALTINPSYKANSMRLLCMFDEESKLEAHVYENDIVNLKDIDVVVCSEDRAGNAKGIVARLLLEKGGELYKQEKAYGFKCLPTFGDIITTRGGGNNYTWIMHAIISRKDPKAIPSMYRKIFHEVESNGYTSVALPLLGTGVGDVDPISCSEMLFDELIHLCQSKGRNGFTLHIVINDKQTTDIVKRVFKRRIDEIKKNKKTNHDRERMDSQYPEGEIVSADKETTAGLHEKAEPSNDCVICMDTVTDAKILQCGHMFCAECIEGYFRVKKVCPTCGKVCGTVTGDQPGGSMIIGKQSLGVAGFEGHRSIVISYSFLDGIQGSDHPRPREPYKGIRRTAYLPDTEEGRRICAMLKIVLSGDWYSQ